MVMPGAVAAVPVTARAPRVAGAPDRLVRFGFLLTDQFSLLALTGFLDSLREIEDHGSISGRRYCEWDILGPPGSAAAASCGVEIAATRAVEESSGYDYLIVIGGRVTAKVGAAEARLLRRAAMAGKTLIGIDTGTHALARIGLLDGFRVCAHWFHLREFQEEFPELDATADRIFIVDRKRITCSGGTCSIDLAAHLIDSLWGPSEATRAIALMGLERPRSPAHFQTPSFDGAPIVRDLRVRRAIQLIERRYDDPPSVGEMARDLGTSERQLERAFKKAVGVGPREFSRLARLRQGHWLLLNTNRSIAQIAFDCGFADASHFARFFRRQFGVTPRQQRSADEGERGQSPTMKETR